MKKKRITRSVSRKIAVQLSRKVKDACRKYPGGLAKLELVKDDPEFESELYKFFDQQVEKFVVTMAFNERPVWKVINLGVYNTVNDIRKAIIDSGNEIRYWKADTIKRIRISNKPSEIELFRSSVADLGFPDGATWRQIKTKLDDFGFTCCPAEVGFQLRLQYTDYPPMDEWNWIVMDPITSSNGDLEVFVVGQDSSGSWLGGGSGRQETFLFGVNEVVFCRR